MWLEFMRASRVFVFLPFVQLLVVGLIVFWPTFELYINADNWIVLWGAKTTIGTASHPWTGWTTYFSPYGMSHMIMYLMSGVFGYAGLPYYVASFFLRFLAASGVYLFLKSIKVAKTSAFLSAVMFLVSPVGLEVTDWVFQMNSFLSIFFLLLTFILLFKLDSTKKVVMAVSILFLAVVINPIRAHGIFLTVWVFSLLGVLISQTKKKMFMVFFAILSVFLFVFLLKAYTFGDPGPTQAMVAPGANMIKDSIAARDASLVVMYFINVGEGVIPGKYISIYKEFGLAETVFGTPRPGIEALGAAVVVLAIVLFWKRYLFKEKHGKWTVLVGILGLLALAFLGNKVMFGTNYSSESRLSGVVGLVSLASIFYFGVLDFFYKKKQEFMLDVLLFGISGFFVLLPWVHNPVSYLHTYNRYMIFSALIAPLMLGNIVGSIKRKRWIGYVAMIMVIIGFAKLTIEDIDYMRFRHHNYYGEKIWGQIDKHLVGEDLNDTRSVFYVKSDNPARLHDLVVSSFPFRMGLYYEIWDFDKVPHAIESLTDFKSMMTDGEATAKYVGKPHVFERKDAYAFEIIDDTVYRLDLNELLENED